MTGIIPPLVLVCLCVCLLVVFLERRHEPLSLLAHTEILPTIGSALTVPPRTSKCTTVATKDWKPRHQGSKQQQVCKRSLLSTRVERMACVWH